MKITGRLRIRNSSIGRRNQLTSCTGCLLLSSIVTMLGTIHPPQLALSEDIRGLSVDDVLKMQDTGRAVLATDGSSVIYERMPAYEKAPNVDELYFYADRRPLAHIQHVVWGERNAATQAFPQLDNGGYWIGAVSPDGKRIAAYSLVDGEIRAGIIEVLTRRTQWFDFNPSYFWANQAPVWISDSELVYSAVSAGEAPRTISRANLARKVAQLWQTSFLGKEPATTVLTSVTTLNGEAELFRNGKLLRVNAITAHASVLAEGLFYNFKLSPDRRFLAALKEAGGVQPDPDRAADSTFDSGTRKQLAVFDLSTGEEIQPCPECDVPLATTEWSANSSVLTLFAAPVGSTIEAGSLFRFTIPSRVLERVSIEGLVMGCDRIWPRPARAGAAAKWMAVFATANVGLKPGTTFTPDCRKHDRFDWYFVRQGKVPLKATATIQSVSGELVAATQDAIFILGDGELWKLAPNAAPKNLTRSVPDPVTRWHADMNTEEGRYLGAPLASTQVILQTAKDALSMDLRSGKYRVQHKPGASAELIAIAKDAAAAVFRVDGEQRSELIFERGEKGSQTIEFFNEHLSGVTPGKRTTLRYDVHGQDASSCILLPPNYDFQKKYPAIVHVYPNSNGGCLFSDIHRFDPLNHQLLAAHGYVVVFANTSERYFSSNQAVVAGVQQAVDAAIEAGYVDPSRIAVFGISQGHHAALEVVSSSQRFKAAVAGFGASDFVSQYGAISLFSRFVPLGSVGIGNPERFESRRSDNYLGEKPWTNPQAFIQSGAIFKADQIHTPLLLIHSDLDLFPLEQSAEIFSALYRLRREATYVTYWGEGHGLLSPANIRDMWSRVFDWYDKHLEFNFHSLRK